MDESDQNQIIRIKSRISIDQQHMHRSFFLCVSAMVICVLVTVYLYLLPGNTSNGDCLDVLLVDWLPAALHWEAQYM
jgi:hypothetical protein